MDRLGRNLMAPEGVDPVREALERIDRFAKVPWSGPYCRWCVWEDKRHRPTCPTAIARESLAVPRPDRLSELMPWLTHAIDCAIWADRRTICTCGLDDLIDRLAPDPEK